MRTILFLILTLISSTIFSQVPLTVGNTSFEGMPEATVTPVPWHNCLAGYTPDTQPGFFEVNVAPYHGSSYLGLLHDIDFGNWQEGVSQVLSSPMISGVTYTFSLYMQQSTSISFTSDPIELEIYGGFNLCDQAELLASSGVVSPGAWQEYSFTFTPSANYTHILFLAHSINQNGGERPYLLVDAMSVIDPCEVGIDSLHQSNTTCNLPNGSIEVFADANFTFEWSNGATSNFVENLDAGDYTVTVSTADGACSWDTTLSILASEELVVSEQITNVACQGASTGEIILTPSNGNAPFSYTWDTGNTSNTNSNLSAGSYSVTVSDNLDCEFIGTYNVSEELSMSISINTTIVSCFGGNNGTATANVSGGMAPYSYNWDSGSTSATADNLSTGTYNLTVIDDNNCSLTSSATIDQSSEILLDLEASQLLCYEDQNGTITTSVSGGNPSYTYLWSNGATTPNISNLNGDLYAVTVTDASNCSVTRSAEITTVSEPLELFLSATSNLCFGDETGTVNSTVTGGTPPYNYLWSNNETGEKIEALSNGIYTLLVSDANNCHSSESASVVSPAELHSDMLDSIQICKLQSTTINSSVTGGVSPYTYLWNTGETTANIIGTTDSLAFLTVNVEDNNGCTTSKSIVLHTYTVPQLFVGASNDTVCPAESIEIFTEITNGLAPYTFTLNGEPANFPALVYPIGMKDYEITITDACNASSSQSISVYAPNYDAIQIISDKTSGCKPLTVRFQTNYDNVKQISWSFTKHQVSNYQSGQNVTHVFDESGKYHVNVKIRTQENCIIEQTVHEMINVFPVPDAVFEMDKEIGDILNTSIYFNNWSEDNKQNYWFFGDGDSTMQISPVHNYKQKGEYEVNLIVENEYSCTDTATQTVEIRDVFKVWIPLAFSPDGDNINDLLEIKGYGVSETDYLFMVYDRWGEIIFQSTSINDSWDGKAKGGMNYVQNGVYKCLLICKDFNGVEHSLSRNVTVIR